jgi:hypothetical protein
MDMLPKVIFMVNWSLEEQKLIQQFAGKKYETVLNEIPENERKWKCHTCYTILKNTELINKRCPVCGETYLQRMCVLDHNECKHDIVASIEICPICHQPLCPICGCHDVAAVSRVTGYLSNIEGWNASKQQELKDRIRNNLGPYGEMHRVHS